MNYKNIIKILLLNILILIALLCALEFYSYNKLNTKLFQAMVRFNVLKQNQKWTLKYTKVREFNYYLDKVNFRPVKIGNKLKRPIIFFGCSFTYGFGLNDCQTLPYKIWKLTNRTVYNRAFNCWGGQHVLYQLRRDDLKKEIPYAEYIVYTFIYDHLDRFYSYVVSNPSETMLKYKIVNNKLSEVKPAFLPCYSLFTVKYVQDAITEMKNNNKDDLIYMFNSIMNESLRLSRIKYPNSKFVILVYKESRSIPDTELTKFNKNINKLKNKGFIVIDAQELVGHSLDRKEYILNDNFHPSEKVWNEIAPKLVKYLKL